MNKLVYDVKSIIL